MARGAGGDARSTASRPTSATCGRCWPIRPFVAGDVRTQPAQGFRVYPPPPSRCWTAAPRPPCRTGPGGWVCGRWACRRRGRWTTWRSAWPTGWWATRGRAGAGDHADRARPALQPAPRSWPWPARSMPAEARRRSRSPRVARSTCPAGGLLRLGAVAGARGAGPTWRCAAAWTCPPTFGSRATFMLGGFGGHGGRALRAATCCGWAAPRPAGARDRARPRCPPYPERWDIAVLYGPHGAPDFFTDGDIQTFFATDWRVHYNSDRTGVRLIGPQPDWARQDGGEAGLHPSNIHDNAYAVGTVDFTGDMPIILGPDGPSLGGFVCPATIVQAERWKMGQLKAGDRVRFRAGDRGAGPGAGRRRRTGCWRTWCRRRYRAAAGSRVASRPVRSRPKRPILAAPGPGRGARPRGLPARRRRLPAGRVRPAGARSGLRLRAHALMQALEAPRAARDHRSDPRHPLAAGPLRPAPAAAQAAAGRCWRAIEGRAARHRRDRVPSAHRPPAAVVGRSRDPAGDREVHARRCADDAPWCPSNIEFIRRINGLDSVDDVKRIVFDASYLVLGLGDVYLGAPVATPLDPRHRLVTTKYNPARTWTPENAVGIGGAYLCIYGMEGPGRLPVRRAHRPDLEHPPAAPPISRRQALAAALLRSDPLLPGRGGRAAAHARRLPARPGAASASRRAPSTSSDYRRLLRDNAADIARVQGPAAGGLRRRARALGRRGSGPGGGRTGRAGRGAARRRDPATWADRRDQPGGRQSVAHAAGARRSRSRRAIRSPSSRR